MNALWLVSTVLAGLNAGLLVAAALERVYLRDVGLSPYLQMHRPRDLLFCRMMPLLLLLLMACCLVLFILSLRSGVSDGRAWLALGAFVLVLADTLFTVRVMVPLNLRLMAYDALRPPAEGEGLRQRWAASFADGAGRAGLRVPAAVPGLSV